MERRPSTGQIAAEEIVPSIPENADAVVSGDGSAVAYSARLNGAESIFVLPLGEGAPKQVCDKCGRIVDWSKEWSASSVQRS